MKDSVENRGFLERNAGKMLIAAFVVPWPLRLFAQDPSLVAVTFLLDIAMVGFAVTGYVQRGRRRKREGHKGGMLRRLRAKSPAALLQQSTLATLSLTRVATK